MTLVPALCLGSKGKLSRTPRRNGAGTVSAAVLVIATVLIGATVVFAVATPPNSTVVTRTLTNVVALTDRSTVTNTHFTTATSFTTQIGSSSSTLYVISTQFTTMTTSTTWISTSTSLSIATQTTTKSVTTSIMQSSTQSSTFTTSSTPSTTSTSSATTSATSTSTASTTTSTSTSTGAVLISLAGEDQSDDDSDTFQSPTSSVRVSSTVLVACGSSQCSGNVDWTLIRVNGDKTVCQGAISSQGGSDNSSNDCTGLMSGTDYYIHVVATDSGDPDTFTWAVVVNQLG